MRRKDVNRSLSSNITRQFLVNDKREGGEITDMKHIIKKIVVCGNAIFWWAVLSFSIWYAYLGGYSAIGFTFNVYGEMFFELFFHPFMLIVCIICSIYILRERTDESE